MLSTKACREILEAAGTMGLSDDQVEHLRYVLAQVARLWLEGEYAIEAALPPTPSWLPARRGA